MSLIEIKNYTKSPRTFYVFSAILLLIIAGMFAFMFYTLNAVPTINTTASKIREALLAEFPQATEQNISNVLESIDKSKSPLSQYLKQYINYFFGIFAVGYLLLIISTLVSIARRDVVTPFPKSLNLGDDLLKFSEDRQKTG